LHLPAVRNGYLVCRLLSVYFFFFVLSRYQLLAKNFVLSLSVCTHVSIRLPRDGTHFLEIWYRRLKKLEIRLKSCISVGHFTWRPKHTLWLPAT